VSGFQTDIAGPYIISNPADNRDYSLDWSANLGPSETIQTSVWSVPAPLSAGSSTINGAVTTQWISGGSPEAVYVISNTITTNQGRTFDRSFRLIVRLGI